MGPVQGWGGPWRYDDVAAFTPSDPYLLTGYNKKHVFLRSEAAATTIWIQVDFTGHAGHAGGSSTGLPMASEPWTTVATVQLEQDALAANGLGSGFVATFDLSAVSGHWVRFISADKCNCTAWLTYF